MERTNRPWIVLINGIESGSIDAPTYKLAKIAARRAYGVSCDVIG